MRRIGLTGGIGSGKSTVADLFADHGASVVDADAIAREVAAPGSPGLAEVVTAFGPGVLTADGSLDRAALAKIVFDDPDARQRLNSITHPLIGQRTAQIISELPADAVVVHDVPLLVEAGLTGAYDMVVVVDAPDVTRVSRLVGRGMSEQDARSRIASQASREERLAAADIVIDNSGSLDDLRSQVDRAWPIISGTA